ncbi:hypothetical protein [Aquabacterium sp. A08]|uniref:hypothetical protein n=1 Tax=Aquabacterium sp. A08 TaxID=2718532 RepID=UPI001420D663|nr:hypothetical protein [Aquabacterium sp. A08]NIC43383.1 hypothetical protein [Aquabacterium sp. A08]
MDIDLTNYRPASQREVELEMRRCFDERAAEERERRAERDKQEKLAAAETASHPTLTLAEAKQMAATIRQHGGKRVKSPEEIELDALFADLADLAAGREIGSSAASPGAERVIADDPVDIDATESDAQPMTAEAGDADERSPALVEGLPVAGVAVAAPSPVVEPIATVRDLVDHEFPLAQVPELVDDSNPHRELHLIAQELACHKDYRRVRAAYCEQSLLLNQVGRLAPAYRPALVSGAPHNDPVHQLIHRDQVVIDLHWCFATQMSLSPTEAAHVALFADPSRFNLEAAWAISGKKWRKGFRSDQALSLTILQQCQLLAIRGAGLQATCKSLGDGWRASGGKEAGRFARFKRALGEWCERDPRMLEHRRSYEMLWFARELLGSSATPIQIAKLHALMLGEAELGRVTVRDKLKKLDRHVPMK